MPINPSGRQLANLRESSEAHGVAPIVSARGQKLGGEDSFLVSNTLYIINNKWNACENHYIAYFMMFTREMLTLKGHRLEFLLQVNAVTFPGLSAKNTTTNKSVSAACDCV